MEVVWLCPLCHSRVHMQKYHPDAGAVLREALGGEE